MEVLAISLARQVLLSDSRERARMRSYAKHLEVYHMIVLTRREHGFRVPVREGNLHLYPTNSYSRFFMLVDAYRLSRRILRMHRDTPIVITAQDPLEVGWLSWILSRMTNVPLHIQLHSDYFSSNAWAKGSVIQKARRFMAMVLLRRVTAIRAVSERIRRSLMQRGINGAYITWLPIRPDIELFRESPHTFTDIPPCTFLYIGRLSPEKNVRRIIDAFALARRTCPHTELRIVGDGIEKVRITKQITELGLGAAIHLCPWTNDAPKEMARADVFLLASLHEAYPLAPIEAMAVGLPIITTDVGHAGEVERDGIEGIIVSDDSTSAYADAMIRMARDTTFRKLCGEHARARALELVQLTQNEYSHAWVKSVEQALLVH